MKWLYLMINFCTIILPLMFSFHPKIKFYRNWKAFLIGSITVALFFIIWDIVFTSMGVWRFNGRYVMGLYVINLPVEEILFFICIPYSCVFTYYCLDKFYNLDWPSLAETTFCLVLSLGLLITGFIFIDRLYTSVTLISTAITNLVLRFVLKVSWYGKAVATYTVLLAPFLFVNGLLTGSGLKEPVVQYNNHENLGIRIFTIPVEDVVYGFELFLLNILFYELLKRRSLHKRNPG